MYVLRNGFVSDTYGMSKENDDNYHAHKSKFHNFLRFAGLVGKSWPESPILETELDSDAKTRLLNPDPAPAIPKTLNPDPGPTQKK